MASRSAPLWVALSVKALCSALLVLVGLQALASLHDSSQELDTLEGWESAHDYAVFYPWLIGEDTEPEDDEATSTTVARDLRPVLEEAGALYVDANQYLPDAAPPDDPLTQSLVVNLSYLDAYPLTGEDGQPVRVDPGETSWVVAAPATLKDQEEEIRRVYTSRRTGDAEIEGAVQAEEAAGEPVPDELRDQEVRIIWTAPGQDVFTADPEVNPEGGSTVRDPLVAVMTPANSLVTDYRNAVTGSIGTALKVYTGGDAEATYRELLPTLRELGLDDNFRYLVAADQAQSFALSLLARDLLWSSLTVLACLVLLALVLGAVAAAVYFNVSYREVAVARLHGLSLPRTYAGLARRLGWSWLAALVLAAALAPLASQPPLSLLLQPVTTTLASLGAADILPVTLALALVILLELGTAALAAAATERRNLTRRLKEL